VPTLDKERPDSLKEIEYQAWAHIKNREYAQTLSLCEDAESRGLRSGELYAVRAIALVELERCPEASALIDEKLQEYPTEPQLYYSKAVLKSKQKKYEDALVICDHAASIGLWNSKIAGAKSADLIMLRRYEEAIVFLKQELEKHPEEEAIYVNLGVAFMATGSYGSALSICKDAESRGLRGGGLYATHADALIYLKRYREASALIEEKMQEHPAEPKIYHSLALLKLKKRKYKDVLAVCDHAVSIGMWDAKLAANKSSALVGLGRYKEASTFIVGELEKYPDEPVLHYNLGSLYCRFNKKTESKQEYETALALDPTLDEFRAKKIKRAREIYAFYFISLIYFYVGLLFWPASRYFLLPFWLLGIAQGLFRLYSALKRQSYQIALKALFQILLFGAVGCFFTFAQPGSSFSFTARLVMAAILLVAFGIILLVKRPRC
jgi:tetratricopeptide (TPR) repeat protein